MPGSPQARRDAARARVRDAQGSARDAPARALVVAGEGHSPVAGLLAEADPASCLLVLGHGAGAPMTHPFMEDLSAALAAEGVSVLRFNFQYAQEGRRRPDPLRRLLAVAASALVAGRHAAADLPLFAGGKSMGGRMLSELAARQAEPPTSEPAAGAPAPVGEAAPSVPAPSSDPLHSQLPNVAGLVFFGFPLHPPGRPGTARGDHLARVPCPMLFHQGDRDRLADLALLRPVLDRLGAKASLRVVEGGDHSFKTPKRLGRDQADVLGEMARETAAWTATAAP